MIQTTQAELHLCFSLVLLGLFHKLPSFRLSNMHNTQALYGKFTGIK